MKMLRYTSILLVVAAVWATSAFQSAYCTDLPEIIDILCTPGRFKNVRSVNKLYKDLADHAQKKLSICRPFANLKEAERQSHGYIKNPQDYLSALQSLLESVKPKAIFNMHSRLNHAEQEALVRCVGLEALEIVGLDRTLVPQITDTIKSLKLKEPDLYPEDMPFYRPVDYRIPSLSFLHLANLKRLEICTNVMSSILDFDVALINSGLESLKIVGSNDSFLQTYQYHLSNPSSLKQFTCLQSLELPKQQWAFSNFSDLTHLNLNSIRVLDLTGCPLIRDHSLLAQMNNLEMVTVDQRAQLPVLPEGVVIIRK